MPRKKSLVWMYFTKDGDNVTCTVCGKSYVQPQGGTTTNMKNHMKINHSKIYYEEFDFATTTTGISPTSLSKLKDLKRNAASVDNTDSDTEETEIEECAASGASSANTSQDSISCGIAELQTNFQPLSQSSMQSNMSDEILDRADRNKQTAKKSKLLFQPKISDMLSRKSGESFPVDSNQEKKLTSAVATFLVKGALPFHLVEQDFFKEFVQSLEPR